MCNVRLPLALALNCLCDLAQVCNEGEELLLPLGSILNPQQRRWMNSDEGGCSIGERKRLPADLGDRDHAPEQAACCGRAERYDRLRVYNGALLLEPPLAA